MISKLIVGLLLVASMVAGPIQVNPVVEGRTINVHVQIEKNPKNIWTCVVLKAHKEDWTPRHCGFSENVTEFVDEWPNMTPDTYDVSAFLQREEGPNSFPSFDSNVVTVEVK